MISKDNFLKAAINKQFEFAGLDLSYRDVQVTEDWYNRFSITIDQEENFHTWFIEEFIKAFKCSKKRARKSYLYFTLGFGLKLAA